MNDGAGSALLRNLRNMDQAGVDQKLVEGAILARKGGAQRVLPFRFIAAARAALGQLRGLEVEEVPGPQELARVAQAVRWAREAGFDCHMTKPADADVVLGYIDAVAHRRQCSSCAAMARYAAPLTRRLGVPVIDVTAIGYDAPQSPPDEEMRPRIPVLELRDP